MATELEHLGDDLRIHEIMVRTRYAERERLGQDWMAKRKAAAAAKTGTDGKPSSMYPRLSLEADMARMAYDMAYMLDTHLLMKQQIEMLSTMNERMAILEGAYSILAMSCSSKSILKALTETGGK